MIIFCWRRQTPPSFLGGAERSEAILASFFSNLGFPVTIIGSYERPWDSSQSTRDSLLHQLARLNIPAVTTATGVQYQYQGIECHSVTQREVLPTLMRYIRHARLLWTSQEGCLEIAAASGTVPVASYMHSISSTGSLSTQIHPQWLFVPSEFVEKYVSGEKAWVLRPPIDWADETDSRLEKRTGALFFNPIAEKGLELVLSLARELSSVSFTFVEGWKEFDAELRAPGNVSYVPQVRDPRPLYRAARVLLVPSMVQDASPRVLLEGASMYCPALGSRRGGIPEYIPSPKNLLDDQIESWLEAVRKILEDDSYWRASIEKQRALSNALRAQQFAALEASGLLEAVRGQGSVA